MIEFDEIYSLYFNDVFLYMKNLSKSDDIAEEITAETFFKAMRSIDNFRGDSSIRVWLCQIAKNTYYTYVKKSNKFVDIDIFNIDDVSVENDPESFFLSKEGHMSIHILLHKLPEPYKEVFTLRVFGELSFKQIGKIFSKTENWACVTFYRAKNKIKEKMEESRNDE